MYCLPELRGKLKNNVRFMVIKVTKKEEPGVFIFHFEKMIICSNMIIEQSFCFRVWFAVYATENKNLDIRFLFGDDFDPDHLKILRDDYFFNFR